MRRLNVPKDLGLNSDLDLDLNAVDLDSDLDSDLKAVDLDLDFLVSAGLGLKGSGLGLGYWWTCYKSGDIYAKSAQ